MALQYVCPAIALFGSRHCRQTPVIENVLPVHGVQARPSARGPSPAWHGLQEVFRVLMIFGRLQIAHVSPRREYLPATQSWQLVLSQEGSCPGRHRLQVR